MGRRFFDPAVRVPAGGNLCDEVRDDGRAGLRSPVTQAARGRGRSPSGGCAQGQGVS